MERGVSQKDKDARNSHSKLFSLNFSRPPAHSYIWQTKIYIWQLQSDVEKKHIYAVRIFARLNFCHQPTHIFSLPAVNACFQKQSEYFTHLNFCHQPTPYTCICYTCSFFSYSQMWKHQLCVLAYHLYFSLLSTHIFDNVF